MFSRLSTRIFAAVSTLASLIAAGTVIFHYMEKWTWIEAFYFSVTTLTTVGYGDLHPTTDLTRLITAIFVLAGVAVALAALSIIGGEYLAGREKQILETRNRLDERRKQRKKLTSR